MHIRLWVHDTSVKALRKASFTDPTFVGFQVYKEDKNVYILAVGNVVDCLRNNYQ